MTDPIRERPNAVPHYGAARHELVILAASAGGIEATSRILDALPASFPTPIAVLQHRSPTALSILKKILGRRCKLRVKNAESGERFVRGTLTVIAQDPATALHSGMPRAAIATGAVDYVLPLEEIGPMPVRLTSIERDEGGSNKEAV